MVATYTQPQITTDDVLVDHPFRPVFHVGPAEVALRNVTLLVRIHNVVADTRTSVITHIAVHDDGTRTAHVQTVGVPGDVVVLLWKILEREAIDYSVSAETGVEINRAVT